LSVKGASLARAETDSFPVDSRQFEHSISTSAQTWESAVTSHSDATGRRSLLDPLSKQEQRLVEVIGDVIAANPDARR